ncbi:uncharacterized protein [Lolium perenne]|uniref:uncharacterized protein n=1 Tax=Lolium perenne TaxID=4522 RepID=UPI003A98D58D
MIAAPPWGSHRRLDFGPSDRAEVARSRPAIPSRARGPPADPHFIHGSCKARLARSCEEKRAPQPHPRPRPFVLPLPRERRRLLRLLPQSLARRRRCASLAARRSAPPLRARPPRPPSSPAAASSRRLAILPAILSADAASSSAPLPLPPQRRRPCFLSAPPLPTARFSRRRPMGRAREGVTWRRGRTGWRPWRGPRGVAEQQPLAAASSAPSGEVVWPSSSISSRLYCINIS